MKCSKSGNPFLKPLLQNKIWQAKGEFKFLKICKPSNTNVLEMVITMIYFVLFCQYHSAKKSISPLRNRLFLFQ